MHDDDTEAAAADLVRWPWFTPEQRRALVQEVAASDPELMAQLLREAAVLEARLGHGDGLN
jgi:hypothetical protein